MLLLVVVYLVVVLAFFMLLQGIMLTFASAGNPPVAVLRRRSLADGIGPWIGEIVRDFENLVATSNIGISPIALLVGMALMVTPIIITLHFFLHLGGLLAVGLGLVLGIAVPMLFLLARRRRRIAKLITQLPEALDMLVRSLRVGHPVPVGIEMVGKEMLDPIGGEFRRAFDTMAYGLDLKDALEQMAGRLQIIEIRYMVAAIRIQYATGGNLGDILATLAEVMRERVRLKAKVKAITAETRLSGNIMSVIPFLLVGGLFYMRPDFYSAVPSSPTLQIIMGVAAGLLLIGVVLMRRIVNIRV